MTDTSWALWVAVYDRLTADLSVPVYERAPEGSAYPYVTLDSEDLQQMDALRKTRDDRYLSLVVWSNFDGSSEVRKIIDGIQDALHRAPLTLTSGRVIAAYVTRRRVAKDADGRTFMGNVTVRVWTEN